MKKLLSDRKKKSLEDLYEQQISKCRFCSLIEETTEPINDVYNTNVITLGEAPGRTENRMGSPFLGGAGKKLFEKGLCTLGFERKDFSILNVVKCYPSKTKKPKEEHVNRCTDKWLNKQIFIIKPIIILVLGNTAAKFVKGSNISITDLSGVCEYNEHYNCWVVYSVHPAWLMHGYTREREEIFNSALKVFSDKISMFQ